MQDHTFDLMQHSHSIDIKKVVLVPGFCFVNVPRSKGRKRDGTHDGNIWQHWVGWKLPLGASTCMLHWWPTSSSRSLCSPLKPVKISQTCCKACYRMVIRQIRPCLEMEVPLRKPRRRRSMSSKELERIRELFGVSDAFHLHLPDGLNDAHRCDWVNSENPGSSD